MDRPRPIWKSGILHAVLIGGSIVFALPYFWLVGTSWKLDKEIQSEEITILPQKPIARTVSPYIDDRHFPEITKPEDVARHRWTNWMQKDIEREIGAVVDDWLASGVEPRVTDVDKDKLRTELVQGVFKRVSKILPYESWTDEELTFVRKLKEVLDTEYVGEAFSQAYRYFAVGKVLLKDRNYKIYELTGKRPVKDIWTVTENSPVELESRVEAERTVGIMHYDFTAETENKQFEISSVFDLPVDMRDFKRLTLSFRRDQSWNELGVLVEVEGRLLESTSPKYLGTDTWSEVNYQEPSGDDTRMTAKHYIVMKEIAKGSQYDHGPGKMKLRVKVSHSSTPEAYWAKGTENYRRAFQEVPFWQYFKTSVFLVIANIVGTALSCSLVAFAFARLKWPGRDFCFLLVLATLMIPPQITMIPSFVIYKYLGWYNTLAPLWVPNCLAVNAFAIFLLRQAMKGIPKDLEEAAQIDGCGWFRIYWSVALPLMRPTIAAVSIFTFMFVWNDFMSPLIYINDQRLYPLALGLFSFMAGRENQFTLIMAGSMIMTLPVILTFFFAQRHFIQGVTMTGMKG